MSAKFHLAQVNIGRLKAPVGDPLIQDFVDNLDRINALAESSPGFVWRLKGDGNNATDLIWDAEDPLVIPNMSTWTDIPSLGAFVYRTVHIEIMRRRDAWFEPMEVFACLWWVPAGHRPTVAEAREKLALLAAHGPTSSSFTFKTPFSPPSGEAVEPELDECA